MANHYLLLFSRPIAPTPIAETEQNPRFVQAHAIPLD